MKYYQLSSGSKMVFIAVEDKDVATFKEENPTAKRITRSDYNTWKKISNAMGSPSTVTPKDRLN